MAPAGAAVVTAWLIAMGVYCAFMARYVGRREHEPRAVKLLGPAKPPCFDRRDIGAHECMYIEVQRLGDVDKTWRCVSCGKPTPTLMPGAVEVRS